MSDTVESLLIKHKISYTISGADFVTKCFNPEHIDSHPSFRIDRHSGISHCFSCGFKTNIFKYYGVLTVSNGLKVSKLKAKLEKIKDEIFGVPIPKGLTEYLRSYRGISLNTLKKFGASTTVLVPELEDRIIFPIKDVWGRTVVYTARHMLSQGNPRYINYPRGVSMPLYPPALEVPSNSLVLVEGLFDLLNLYDNGLTNVACCFGTSTLKGSAKEKLLPFKAQGVEKIYILFDADPAGIAAAKELKPILEELEFQVEVITLQENTDPGDLSKEDIESITEYIK